MSYAIMVRLRGASKETELCRVASNPATIVEAAKGKMLLVDDGRYGGRKIRVPKYEHVHAVEVK